MDLIQGKILKRYKRFLSDVELPDGTVVTAHTPNTGSMKTCWEPGYTVCLSRSENPKRKLPYTLELTHNGKTWINVNTGRTNQLAVEAIREGVITELAGYPVLKREQKVGNSRIDLLLEKEGSPPCYVEVKNVTLLGAPKKATFPDSVSARGLKHLQELTALTEQGLRSCMLFIVSREDVECFGPAFSLDPEYAEGLVRAKKAGVEILAYRCRVSPEKTKVTHRLPLKIKRSD